MCSSNDASTHARFFFQRLQRGIDALCRHFLLRAQPLRERGDPVLFDQEAHVVEIVARADLVDDALQPLLESPDLLVRLTILLYSALQTFEPLPDGFEVARDFTEM